MFSVRSILVDIDAVAGPHPALETAQRVAQRSAARLKLVDVVPDVPWLARRFASGGVERDLVSYREEHLRTIASSIAASGLHVETAVLRGRPSLALSREVIESKHDLLVRAHGRSGSVEARQFGAIDMQILRLCDCPVWLVAPAAARPPLRVLVAIHANPEDATEQDLNLHIIDWTSAAVRPDAGEITVLQAWIAFAEQLVSSRMPREDLAAYVESMRGAASDALHMLVPQIRERLGDVRLELIKGEPADAIAQFAAETCGGSGCHGHHGAWGHSGHADGKHGGVHAAASAVLCSRDQAERVPLSDTSGCVRIGTGYGAGLSRSGSAGAHPNTMPAGQTGGRRAPTGTAVMSTHRC